ncbi:hypothetical protein [Marinobacter metalliresistant]|uniref:Efflux RND transporter permease subunit n=1 Tax=Marinobacter metalliresistant TaxID=2961995 RepID=A0ABZ2W2P2_9GAMM
MVAIIQIFGVLVLLFGSFRQALILLASLLLAIGNEMWRPLCFAVIFGLLASTVLSLIIIPCLYRLFTPPEAG